MNLRPARKVYFSMSVLPAKTPVMLVLSSVEGNGPT